MTRLRGKGVARKGKEPGDLYVKFIVHVPTVDDPEVAKAVDVLAAKMTEDPRAGAALLTMPAPAAPRGRCSPLAPAGCAAAARRPAPALRRRSARPSLRVRLGPHLPPPTPASAPPPPPAPRCAPPPAAPRTLRATITLEPPFRLDRRIFPSTRAAFLADLADRTALEPGRPGPLAAAPPPVPGHPRRR